MMMCLSAVVLLDSLDRFVKVYVLVINGFIRSCLYDVSGVEDITQQPKSCYLMG